MNEFSVVLRLRCGDNTQELKANLMEVLLQMRIAVLDCTVVADDGVHGAAVRKLEESKIRDTYRHRY